jgi:outer membrane protein TolC
MRIHNIALILLSVVNLSPLFAQERLRLTEDDAIELGLSSSLSLHSSQMAVNGARAVRSEALTRFLPTLSAAASYTRTSNVPPFEVELPPYPGLPSKFTVSPVIRNNCGLILNLTQPLFTGFALTNSYRSVSSLSAAQEYDLMRDSTDVELAIRIAYWNLYLAGDLKTIIGESIRLVEAHLTDAENFFEQGLLTRNDVLKIETELSQMRLKQIQAESGERLATLMLQKLLRLPSTTVIEIISRPEPTVGADPGVDSLITVGLSMRSDLFAVRERVRAAKAGVGLARSGWYPKLMLTGNFQYMRPNPRILPTVDEWEETWDIGLALTFDIWNWGRTRHQTRRASAAFAQARDALEQMRDAVELDISAEYFELLAARQSVEVAMTGVRQADENYRVTKERFGVDLASNTDLLDAEVALLRAKTNHTKATVNQILAEARLRRAVEM